MFIMAFCISTIVTIPCCIYIYAIKYEDYDDSATDYSACLYYSQFAANNPQGLSATELCGEHPSQRPPMFPFLFIMIYTAGLPLFSLFSLFFTLFLFMFLVASQLTELSPLSSLDSEPRHPPSSSPASKKKKLFFFRL